MNTMIGVSQLSWLAQDLVLEYKISLPVNYEAVTFDADCTVFCMLRMQ